MIGPRRLAATTEAELASRVAHQINNPLTVVIANLDVALSELAVLGRELDRCAALEERLRDAREAAERLHRTVRELTRRCDTPPPWSACSTQPESPPATAAEAAAAPVRRGRVLVIDDEQLIATAVRRTLAVDHEVLTVGRARDALQHLQTGTRFDLILCDLTMPEMNGMELYAELTRVAPDQAQRVVFLTGGACTDVAHDFLVHVPNACIEKPFDTRRLRALVAAHMRAHAAIAS